MTTHAKVFKFGCYFFVDTKKHLVSSDFAAHLQLFPDEVYKYVTGPLEKQEIELFKKGEIRKQTVSDRVGPYERYMLTMSQVNEVMDNAIIRDKVMDLAMFINHEVVPLFEAVTPKVETLPAATKPETMSSLEIAKLTGKEHKNVIRDIERIFTELKIEPSAYLGTYQDVTGRNLKCYHLNEELTLTLTSGYSIVQRNAIIKEWQAHRKSQVIMQPVTNVPEISPSAKVANTDKIKFNAAFLKIAIAQIESMNLPPERKQVLKAHLMHEQTGLPLDLMLPVVYEEKLSPAQIALRMNVSAQAIGHIISKLGIRGNETYCEPRLSYVERSNRDVIVHFYNNQAINMIKQALKDKQNEKKN